jgi:hypothetical protein
MSHRATVLVMAKAPVPGAVKTRLCPPCTPAEAAALADAALRDTLDAARAFTVVVALDGAPGDWLPPGVEWFAQRGNTFNERLEHAWARVATPLLQIGMDTPQLTPALLALAVDLLEQSDAVLGPAVDGGWWGLGLRDAPPGPLFDGIGMSRDDTARQQRKRLRDLGLRVTELEPLRDVDTIDDARAVAALAPTTRFARALSI